MLKREIKSFGMAISLVCFASASCDTDVTGGAALTGAAGPVTPGGNASSPAGSGRRMSDAPTLMAVGPGRSGSLNGEGNRLAALRVTGAAGAPTGLGEAGEGAMEPTATGTAGGGSAGSAG